MTCSPLRSRTGRSSALLAGPGLALVLALTACGGTSPDGGTDAATTPPEAEQVDDLTLDDGWVKSADSGMTGAFGTLVNDTNEDVRLSAASSSAAETVELHETVMGDNGQMVMQEKPGGIVVPAGGEYVLEPGGDHMMLLGLTGPVAVGDDVVITLETEDGDTFEVVASGREYAGADESYVPDEGGMDMDSDTGSDGAMTQGNG